MAKREKKIEKSTGNRTPNNKDSALTTLTTTHLSELLQENHNFSSKAQKIQAE